MKKLFALLAVTVFFIAGCQNPNSVEPVNDSGTTLEKSYSVSPEVHAELQAVKAATAKYNDINQAIADGYADINVVVPHMGHHFLKQDYLDNTFELTKPEILVYELKANGKYKLVAVEYGTPLSNANPPDGFTGSGDVWVPNTGAGIWTLHAWIWEYNPAGVFNGINPNVP